MKKPMSIVSDTKRTQIRNYFTKGR